MKNYKDLERRIFDGEPLYSTNSSKFRHVGNSLGLEVRQPFWDSFDVNASLGAIVYIPVMRKYGLPMGNIRVISRESTYSLTSSVSCTDKVKISLPLLADECDAFHKLSLFAEACEAYVKFKENIKYDESIRYQTDSLERQLARYREQISK